VDDSPDPDAYGRVTNPERYAPLHQFAQSALDDLVARFDAAAEPSEGPLRLDRLVRVCPRDGGGGCLAFELTSFPGVRLHVGRWHTYHFPRCGCDACDEQLADVENEMTALMDAFVGGRFTEYLDGGRLGQSWSSSTGSSNGWSELPASDPRRSQPAEYIDWPAWPMRSEKRDRNR
jgi:hypothetical protein